MLAFPVRMCDITGLNLQIHKLHLDTYFSAHTFSSSYIICQIRSLTIATALLKLVCMSKCSVSLYLNVGCHKRGIATGLGLILRRKATPSLQWWGVRKTAYGKEQLPAHTLDICKRLETKPITGVTQQLRMVLCGRWTRCTMWR